MVRLRLRRKGRRHYPVYDIVAVDQRQKRDGAFIESVGFFNPNNHPNTLQIDHDRAVYWLEVGAQPTEVVSKILGYEGILLRKHLKLKGKNQVEIEEAVKQHKQNSLERYYRLKDRRKQKKIDAEKAKEEAEKKEAEGTAAEAPAEEAPAEETA